MQGACNEFIYIYIYIYINIYIKEVYGSLGGLMEE